MNPAYLSLMVCVVTIAAYLAIYLTRPVGVGFNITFAVGATVVMFALAVFYNGYSVATLGFKGDLVSSLAPALALTTFGIVVLWLKARMRGDNPRWENDMSKAVAFYALFGVLQQYLFQGILGNLLADAFSVGTAIAVTGLIFGGIHIRWKDWGLVALTGIMGSVMAWIFHAYRDLWTLGLVHGALAVAMYEWERHHSTWRGDIAPALQKLRKLL